MRMFYKKRLLERVQAGSESDYRISLSEMVQYLHQMPYIADSSLFILRKRLGGNIITVPSVVLELRDESARTALELMNVRIEPPLLDFIKEVREKAGITKDSEELSTTDIDILAKALEYSSRGAILITDDFAVQNTALQLGIQVMPAGGRKIKDVLLWEKLCTGCKRRFPQGDECPVCGSPLKKIRKRKVLFQTR